MLTIFERLIGIKTFPQNKAIGIALGCSRGRLVPTTAEDTGPRDPLSWK